MVLTATAYESPPLFQSATTIVSTLISNISETKQEPKVKKQKVNRKKWIKNKTHLSEAEPTSTTKATATTVAASPEHDDSAHNFYESL